MSIKKSVKRRPRVLEARDLLSVTGGNVSSLIGGPTIGYVPTGPHSPAQPFPWPGPTIGFAPTGPKPILK
jgi:hypothetical protein